MKRKSLGYGNQQSLLLKQRRPLIMDKRAVIRGLMRLFFLGAFIGGTVFCYVWTRLEVLRLNYRLLEISKNERNLYIQNERLKVDMALLVSPSRLSSMAKNQFKLKNPEQNQVIYMK